MLTLNEKGCNIAATQKSVCQFFCDVLLAKRETYLHDLNVKYDLKCYQSMHFACKKNCAGQQALGKIFTVL